MAAAGSKKKNRTVSEIMRTEKQGEVEKKSKEISVWIETVLGEKLPKPSLRENLLDGVVLCKLINVMSPGALRRFHKKPRMLAMKIENIGFFLATCKTRMNLPPALLFQPTDIHDDSNNLTSMSKVLNVLSFLKGDGDSAMIEPLEDDEDEEDGGAGGEGKEHEVAEAAAHEPEIEIEPEPAGHEPEIEVEPEPVPPPTTKQPPPVVAPAPSVPAPTPAPAPAPAAATNPIRRMSSATTGEDHDAQSEIYRVIVEFVNNELSIDSKKKLLRLLKTQLSAFEESVMSSSDDQLVSLARTVGVEASSRQQRATIVSEMLKKGRIQ